MSRERESRDNVVAAKRKERVPLHEQKRDVLKVSNRDPNYHYRIVNDVVEPNGDHRVDMFKRAGYDVVTNSEVAVGDVGGDRDASLGGAPKVIVDKSTGRKGVVMRIPLELYEEDQRAKQKKITQDENNLIRRPRNPNQSTEDENYGEVSLKRQ